MEDPPAAASAESEDEDEALATLLAFVLPLAEGMVSGTMATECMAESRKEGLPGSWLCIVVLCFDYYYKHSNHFTSYVIDCLPVFA